MFHTDPKKCESSVIIFSMETSAGFLSELWRVFDLKLCLDNYTGLEIFLILQQRIKWLNWKIENDDVIKYIAVKSQRNPGKALEMLQNAYFFMRSRNDEIIKLEDVKRGRGIGYNTKEKYDDGYDEKEWEGL